MMHPLALPAVALGMAAIYLLLPRPRPYPLAWGVLAGGLSLLLGGWLLFRSGPISVSRAETILFTLFSVIAIVSAGLLVTQHNPVRAALSFALVVLSTCGLFLLQAAPFLMAASIIVYAGAIIVTFLFVIMLAQQSGLSDADVRSREPLLACGAGFVLLGGILFVLATTYDNSSLDVRLGQANQALAADSISGLQAVLGDDSEFLEAFRLEASKLPVRTEARKLLEEAVSEAESALKKGESDLPQAQKALGRLRDVARAVRDSYGSLSPPAGIPLSGFSGMPANQPLMSQTRNFMGQLPLPAENTAALGRSLFTDFLLAVELGGTLLLVATVGAIVIAGRKTEGLR